MSTRPNDGSERRGGRPGARGRPWRAAAAGGTRRSARGPDGTSRGKTAPGMDLTADPGHDSLIDVPGGVRLQKVLAAAGVRQPPRIARN